MQSLESFLTSFPHLSLLCIGDIMLDYFIYGRVDRISPEAPIPVFHITQKTCVLGGAGNVVRNLSSLQVPTHFISVIGSDQEGRTMAQLFQELTSVKCHLISDESRFTTTKTRYIAHNQQLLRADDEATHFLSIKVKDRLKIIFKKLLPQIDIIILSDYGKGIFDHDLVQFFIQEAKKSLKPIIIDPKGNDYTLYQGATFLTPNLNELSQACGKNLKADDEIVNAGQELIQKCDIETLLVTRGDKGMSLISREGKVEHIATEALEVFDVSGAGDTVIAMFSAALAAKTPLFQSAQLANLAAGIVVGKVGTATASLKEVQEKISAHEFSSSLSKIQLLEEAGAQVIKWKRQGLKIGFTNGCFDLLHPGHIALLTQSRNVCDRLIVGLNSDESVKRLKGSTRPIQNQESRATILASLEMVDMVIIFEEDTPLRLIQQLRPHALVKGADYLVDEIVGSKEVISWGGEVIRADLIPAQSTTLTLQRMK